MVKILHSADFHLDSAFSALSESRARQRRQECRQLTGRLVDFANEQGAELLLLSGDLFDARRVYAQTAEELARALSRFRGEVVIAPGNHDPYTHHSPYAREKWPENVHIFTQDTLEKLEFPQYNCVVYGAAFTAAESGELQLPDLSDDGRTVLLVLHGEVGVQGSRYRTISADALARSGADYAALGHIHQYSGVQRAGNTAYAYPGCPEGRGFDELGEKGVLLGTVDKGKVDLRFVPFAGRRYEQIEVDVTDGDIFEAVSAALAEQKENIVRVILRGETEEAPDLRRLQQQLEGSAWELELRDKTRRREDLWQHCGEDTLRGLFLDELRGQYDSADDERRAVIEQAVRFGLAAMDDREL